MRLSLSDSVIWTLLFAWFSVETDRFSHKRGNRDYYKITPKIRPSIHKDPYKSPGNPIAKNFLSALNARKTGSACRDSIAFYREVALGLF